MLWKHVYVGPWSSRTRCSTCGDSCATCCWGGCCCGTSSCADGCVTNVLKWFEFCYIYLRWAPFTFKLTALTGIPVYLSSSTRILAIGRDASDRGTPRSNWIRILEQARPCWVRHSLKKATFIIALLMIEVSFAHSHYRKWQHKSCQTRWSVSKVELGRKVSLLKPLQWTRQ